MRIRISFLLCIPLVAVLVTGCSEESSAPQPAKSTAVGGPQPAPGAGGGKAAKRKPKDPTSFKGPEGVVP